VAEVLDVAEEVEVVVAMDEDAGLEIDHHNNNSNPGHGTRHCFHLQP